MTGSNITMNIITTLFKGLQIYTHTVGVTYLQCFKLKRHHPHFWQELKDS